MFKKNKILICLTVATVLFLLFFTFTSFAWVESIRFVNTSNYIVDDVYIYGVYPGDTMQDIVDDAIDSSLLRCRTANNKELEITEKAFTGARVQVFAFSKAFSTTHVVIRGDVNGDGDVKSSDYMQIKSHFKTGQLLKKAFLEAADVNDDDRVGTVDYMKLKAYLDNKLELFPERNANSEIKEYTGPYSEVNGAYGGVDDLGREQLGDTDSRVNRTEKEVGVFYFLWHGQHGSSKTVYDNTQILKMIQMQLIQLING